MPIFRKRQRSLKMVIVVRVTTGTSTASCVNLAKKAVLSALPANVALHVNMKTCSSKMALVNARVFKTLMAHAEAALKDITSTNSATHANNVVLIALNATTGTPVTRVEMVLTRSKAFAGVRLRIMVLVSLVCLSQPQLILQKKSQKKSHTQSQKSQSQSQKSQSQSQKKNQSQSQKKSQSQSQKKSQSQSQKKSHTRSQKKSHTRSQKKNKIKAHVMLVTYMFLNSVSVQLVPT